MEWFEALILGLIQGLTEYLPVSSSGHLAIGSALFGIEGEENLAFTIVVHVATVFSTLVILWKEIDWIFKGLFKWQMNEETRYVINILVSMIPIGIVGVFFKDEVEAIFGSGLVVVGCCLLLTALLLSFSYYYKPKQKENISMKDAFIIGLAQACAVLPGLSRSGSTIATGLLLGDNKAKLAQFSFLMVMPPILGEALLDGMKMMKGEAVAGGYSGAFAGGRFPGCFCFGLPGLQVDDKYCEEGQADLFCHLLRDSRCHNAHIKLKSPPCVGERLITPEINKRKILSCTILSPSLPGRG